MWILELAGKSHKCYYKGKSRKVALETFFYFFSVLLREIGLIYNNASNKI